MSTDINVKDLSEDIRKAIAELQHKPEIESVGVVTRVGDGIAWIYGLTTAGYNEMIDIQGLDGKTVTAFAFNLGQDEIGAVLLGDHLQHRHHFELAQVELALTERRDGRPL